jgi:hypothetical protein
MTARKIANTQVTTDALAAAGTGKDSDTVIINAASSFNVTLDKYTDYSHLVIHITNSGALTALTGTFALTCGTIGSTIALPASPVTVAGSLANPAAATSYDSLIIIKAGFFTKLKLAYTAGSGSGSLAVKITTSNID